MRTENDRDAFFIDQSIHDSLSQVPGIGVGGVHLPVADYSLFLDVVDHHAAPAWTKDGSSGKARG